MHLPCTRPSTSSLPGTLGLSVGGEKGKGWSFFLNIHPVCQPEEREEEGESERHTVFSLADGFSDTKKLAIELNDGEISVRIRVEMRRGNGRRVIGITGMGGAAAPDTHAAVG